MRVFDDLSSRNERVLLPEIKDSGVELWIKREDLIHDSYGGNKIRKLKYHISEFKQENYDGILTFGGAWSNHIYAASSLLHELNIPSIGIIRGEEPQTYSKTLEHASAKGMKLHFISRNDYRKRNDTEYLAELKVKYPKYYFIPEGGSGKIGVKGCKEILTSDDKEFDIIVCACGTGGTLSGIINSMTEDQLAIGFSALKNGDFLIEDVKKLVEKNSKSFSINSDYHFGGYAKIKNELIEFMRSFYTISGIKLDPIYTGKMMYGIVQLIKHNSIPKGSKILAIHTGGLQGIKGIELKLKNNIY